MLAVDMNRDGWADLVILGTQTDVLMSNGDGTFAAAVEYVAGGFDSWFAAGDLNGDGWPDLVVNTVVLLNQGNGVLGMGPTLSRPPGGFALGDVDGDGKVDMVVSGTSLSVLFGNGDGTFGAPQSYPQAALGSVLLADLDGDGRLDVAVPSTDAGGAAQISVLLNQGDGTFGAALDYPASFGNSNGYHTGVGAIAAADLNGDGALDLVTAGVNVLLNQGHGTFAPSVDYPLGQYPVEVAVADVNGDGKPDVIAADLVLGANVLLNHGDGSFAASTAFGANANVDGLAVADFNADGRPDVAMCSYEQSPAVFLDTCGP
jgi:hypothetical protein